MVSTNYRGILHLGILVKSGRLNLGLSMNSPAFEDLAASLQCCSPGDVEKVIPHLSPSLLFFCFICSYLSFYLDFLLFHFCCKTLLLCWLQSGKILMMTQSKRSDTEGSSGKGRVRHRSWMSGNTKSEVWHHFSMAFVFQSKPYSLYLYGTQPDLSVLSKFLFNKPFLFLFHSSPYFITTF